ncbi:hypothetical protein [Marmoricola endophyticus]|uniref:hypothetical protein n=1 Tax=Marmoricola endophyticus TaxID=2040280 RepID=UPI00166A97B7|nr:hypothetical protein [Marmoricola endophyticus]
MSEKLKRPQQVTMAAIVAGTASLVMLISIGDRLSRWNSVDLRDGFADFLARDDLGERLGLSLGQAMGLARVGLFVAAALAAAILVLVVFAARRDKGARVAMTVLAVPLMLVGLLVDAFLAGFVLAGAVLLWSEPARDWYAGRAPRERPTPPTAPPQGQQPPSPSPFQAPPPSAPPSAQGGPAAYAGTYGAPPVPPQAVPAQPLTRPTQVVIACVTTWVVSGLVAVFTLVSLVSTFVPGTRGEVRDQVEQALADSDQKQAMASAGITVDELVTAAQVVLVLVLLWALVAVVLAVLAFAGRGWARVTLIVSASCAALLGILGALGAVPLILVSLACAFAISRLISRPAAQWYAAPKGP